MDTRAKRRWLAALAIIGGAYSLLRRPLPVLVGAVVLYINSESLLGVAPLKPYEFTDLIWGAKETTIAAAGVLVAIASVTAFKHVKRLDLELAAAADITGVIRDLSALLARNRVYCDSILELREKYLSSMDGDTKSAADRGEIRRDIDAGWAVLTASASQTRDDLREVWRLIHRLNDLQNQHGAVLRSRFLAPWMLERAAYHVGIMAEAAIFPIPGPNERPGQFIPPFLLLGASRVTKYLEVDAKHSMRAMGYLGAASSIGATSVAPVSLLNAARMGWKFWRM